MMNGWTIGDAMASGWCWGTPIYGWAPDQEPTENRIESGEWICEQGGRLQVDEKDDVKIIKRVTCKSTMNTAAKLVSLYAQAPEK